MKLSAIAISSLFLGIACQSDPFRPAAPSASSPPQSTSAMTDLDALWDFSNAAQSEASFRELAQREPKSRELAMTQVARAQGLQGDFAGAHGTLDEVLASLETDPTRAQAEALTRYYLERGRVFNSSGQPVDAQPEFERALSTSKAFSLDGLTVDALHMLAIVDSKKALEWNRQALQVAETSPKASARRWRASLCNNMGWTLHDQGEFAEALTFFERALELRRENDQAGPERIARWAVARCQRSLGLLEQAFAAQEQLVKDGAAAGAPSGYVHEELGELHLALGRPEASKAEFARAYELLSQDAYLVDSEPERLKRMAELAGIENR